MHGIGNSYCTVQSFSSGHEIDEARFQNTFICFTQGRQKDTGGAGTHTGHTRDTRAHKGTRTKQTNLTTIPIEPSKPTNNTQPARQRDDRSRGRLNSRRPGVPRYSVIQKVAAEFMAPSRALKNLRRHGFSTEQRQDSRLWNPAR